MQKNTHIRSLSILFLSSIVTLGVSLSFADTQTLTGMFGVPYTLGSFSPTGNAGKIIVSKDDPYTVDADPSDPTGSGLVLTGRYMFLETAGWIEFTHDKSALPGTDIGVKFSSIPSDTTINEWKLAEPLYGWSDNAGWIDFNDTNVSSGLIYRGGGLSSFTGYAWSENLGWLDFSKAVVDFLNKVKVIGSIGGNKTFDVVYNVGEKFNSVSVTDLLNKVRRNIGLMTRSVGNDKINTTTSTANKLNDVTVLYKISGQTLDNADDLFDESNPDPLRTYIIIGSDLIIDGDVLKNPNVKTSRAIIVLKNEAGQGGNIYINGNVKNIYATLLAEGSVFSGDNASSLYNDNEGKRDALPRNQLYINGSVISRNTIGGSQKTPLSCPYTVSTADCTKNEAAIYDWNYFRTYDKTNDNRSEKSGYDDYSVVIEYDPKLIQDPPPGLEN